MSRLLETLAREVLVADGGMGSQLHLLVDGHFVLPDQVVLRQPERVSAIHVDYLRAGARLLETCTFGANRIRLAEHGLGDELAAINARAAKLAREAREVVGVDAFVAGSIGPTGLRLSGSAEQATRIRDAFAEQAAVLDDRGVDVFVLETFASIRELALALEAVRSTSSLPVIAQVALPVRDAWGDADDAEIDPEIDGLLRRLAALDADVIGLNCSMGPGQLLPYLRQLASLADRPLAVQPNSGLPWREAGRFVYPSSSPSYWEAFARDAVQAGARIIGGCCGTGPDQIAAVSGAVARLRSVEVVRPQALQPGPAPQPAVATPASGLRARLEAGEFVVSMQVDPPKGTRPDMVLEAVRAFRDSGHVHAVDVNSNPMARLHMDALWLSAAIEAEGMETIAHYTPRDASLMGIQGNLLGAWRAGVRNVLVITGDPSLVRGEPGLGDVYQTDSIGMVKYLTQLNEGKDCFGNTIGDPPAFHVGVAVNPNHDQLDREVERFRRKVDAGAQFAMTQVFFEWGCWERFLDKLGGTCPIPVLVAIWPLTSLRLAVRLHHEVPGIVVPDSVLSRLEQAGAGARDEGFALARQMLEGARARAQGVYVIAPFKRPVNALELFETPG
ncbi:MAG: bifunctional homocysteine S-methyltransferase/methylenetetrahydrofolate reductase [Alphaproteobacteria bacterium]|nr:bifunctional homocysteine S-methyltransferase/methylenetetrahydrofolate reductase [Alphaproteobacteria bacterium]